MPLSSGVYVDDEGKYVLPTQPTKLQSRVIMQKTKRTQRIFSVLRCIRFHSRSVAWVRWFSSTILKTSPIIPTLILSSCNGILIILPVVLYGCEAWSLTAREERKLRVFENMVLRRIFGPRRDEVTGEWRRLHNEELNGLYSSLNIMRVIKSRRMRWAGHVVRMGEERGPYRVLVAKPEGKRPLGRSRHRWVDIRMDLQDVGCGYVDWIG